jgi:hypothetical protein
MEYSKNEPENGDCCYSVHCFSSFCNFYIGNGLYYFYVLGYSYIGLSSAGAVILQKTFVKKLAVLAVFAFIVMNLHGQGNGYTFRPFFSGGGTTIFDGIGGMGEFAFLFYDKSLQIGSHLVGRVILLPPLPEIIMEQTQ